MKKINTMNYGGKVIGIGLLFLVFIPAVLYGINCLLRLPAIAVLAAISAGIGAAIEAGFGVVLFVELRQDRIISKFYERNPSSLKTPQQILNEYGRYRRR